ncbi:MAG: hypothetical protein AAF235_03010 [Planctomycetota bacterium]
MPPAKPSARPPAKPRKTPKKPKSRKRSSSTGPGPITALRSAANATFSGLRTARTPITIVVIAGACVGVAFGAAALRDEASQRLDAAIPADAPAFVFDWPRLVADDPTSDSWLPDYYREQIIYQASGAAGRRQSDALSPAALRDVTETLEASGWFRSRPVARRTPSGAIAIDADWRIPVAVVRVNAVDHLVSTEALPMPVRYGEGESQQQTITGAARIVPEGYARPWPGEAVAAAIDLMKLLNASGFRPYVAGIDLTRYQREGFLQIRSVSDRLVVWGSAPSVFRPGEATETEKLDRLRRLVESYGSIDAGRDDLALYGPRLEIDRRPETP